MKQAFQRSIVVIMRLEQRDIVPRGGSFFAHLFENPSVGLERDLYWNFTLDFEPVHYLDQEWDISAAVEWIRLAKSQSPLDNVVEMSAHKQPNAEASFYLAEHWQSDEWQLNVESANGNRSWKADFAFLVDFAGLDDDPVPNLKIKGSVAIGFAGFIVIPENLSPKPGTVEEAAELLSQYVTLDSSFSCTDETWRYVFNRR